MGRQVGGQAWQVQGGSQSLEGELASRSQPARWAGLPYPCSVHQPRTQVPRCLCLGGDFSAGSGSPLPQVPSVGGLGWGHRMEDLGKDL